MIKKDLGVRETFELRTTLNSMEQESIPYFLSSLTSGLVATEAINAKAFPTPQQEYADALATIHSIEGIAKTNFSDNVKNKTLDLFKGKRSELIAEFSTTMRALEINKDKIKKRIIQNRILTQEKIDTDKAINDPNRTALMSAVAMNDEKFVDFLISSKPSTESKKELLNKQSAYGFTALMIASIKGYTKIAEKLIESGADINLKDNQGRTALYLADHFGNTDIAQKIDSMQDKKILKLKKYFEKENSGSKFR